MPGVSLTIGPSIVALLALAGADSAHRCEEVPGWEHARDQKPSPVPYTEAEKNYVVQLGGQHWSWNGNRISSETFFSYLERVARMEPRPVMLVKFSDKIGCPEIRALKARIAAAANCSVDWPVCLEGTSADYNRARRIR